MASLRPLRTSRPCGCLPADAHPSLPQVQVKPEPNAGTTECKGNTGKPSLASASADCSLTLLIARISKKAGTICAAPAVRHLNAVDFVVERNIRVVVRRRIKLGWRRPFDRRRRWPSVLAHAYAGRHLAAETCFSGIKFDDTTQPFFGIVFAERIGNAVKVSDVEHQLFFVAFEAYNRLIFLFGTDFFRVTCSICTGNPISGMSDALNHFDG